jgi:hypothetical protein
MKPLRNKLMNKPIKIVWDKLCDCINYRFWAIVWNYMWESNNIFGIIIDTDNLKKYYEKK